MPLILLYLIHSLLLRLPLCFWSLHPWRMNVHSNGEYYLSIMRFVIRFIRNGFDSDYSICDNSSCNFDSLSHRTFHLANNWINNECIYFYLCDIIFIDCNNINRRIILILPVKDFHSYLFYYTSTDNFAYIQLLHNFVLRYSYLNNL